MINKFKKAMRGFTLIELLVVIAIIGLLASIVLVSLSNARRKARDSRRVGDLRSVQLALELYFDANQSYPAGVVAAGTQVSGDAAGTAFRVTLAAALVPTYLGGMPRDPSEPAAPAGSVYQYGYAAGTGVAAPLNCVAATLPCLHYTLFGTLEENTNPSLRNDNDQVNGGFAANNGIQCELPSATDAAAGTNSYCVSA